MTQNRSWRMSRIDGLKLGPHSLQVLRQRSSWGSESVAITAIKELAPQGRTYFTPALSFRHSFSAINSECVGCHLLISTVALVCSKPASGPESKSRVMFAGPDVWDSGTRTDAGQNVPHEKPE